MSYRKLRSVEGLEDKRLLAVTATVVDGDLIVEGDADGAVEIVAIGEGQFRVSGNGVLIADESLLTGVTDDLHIRLDVDGNANDVVTVDLSAQALDRVYASLGDGDNIFELLSGDAAGLVYRGGDGADSVLIAGGIDSRATVFLGEGDNDLTVTAQLAYLSVGAGDGDDTVTLADTAVITHSVSSRLGDGQNALTHSGSVEGRLTVSAGDGDDTVTISEGATVSDGARIGLGNGANTTSLAGEVGGSVAYDGGDGDDAVTIEETAVIADAFFAKLGAGDNSVTHAGVIEGDLWVVSQNEDDSVDVSDAAVVGGETLLGLGEQVDHRGGCDDRGGPPPQRGARRGFFGMFGGR